MRGRGLLLAFDLVKDRETAEPFPDEVMAFRRPMEIGIERGLILLARKPPRLMHGDRQADFFVISR